ncbi:hypothetical protein [Sphingobacterium sp. HSC-15S19]|uniref:hypothetical protein n=1 Tax=Sphingobacterium sp. HSC-15S19 TaxID=2910971 RepID=UPI003D211842
MKTQITEKQKAQFNLMLEALKAIKAYQSPSKLRKESEKDWGLEYEEALEMSYENIQTTATLACKNIKPLK